MKVRELITLIQRQGGVEIRQSGSHRMFRLPNGATLPVVAKYMNSDLTKNVRWTARKALSAAGLSTEGL